VPKFVARFKTKAQVKVWHQKWDVLEYEDEKGISEYATRFKKIYKRVDPHKSTPIRTIIRKFINSLPPKYVELLTIMGPVTLEKAIEAAIDIVKLPSVSLGVQVLTFLTALESQILNR